MPKKFFFPLFIAVIFFSNCSQLEKKDCAQIDWYELGKRDGAKGSRSTLFLQHSLKCKKLPKSSEYHRGRKVGLRDFCTLESGIDYGLTGALYIGQCDDFSSTQIKSFKTGLTKGRDVYRQTELISELTQNLKDIEYELGTTFHEKEEMRELEIQRQSLVIELRSERQYLDKLIRSLPPRNLEQED